MKHYMLLIAFCLLVILLSVLTARAQPAVSIRYFCMGDSVKLVAKSQGADYYNWYKNGALIQYEINDIITVRDTGTYEVIAFSLYGCTSEISDPVRLIPKMLEAFDDSARVHATASVKIRVLDNDLKGCSDLMTETVSIYSYPTMGNLAITKDGIIEYKANDNAIGIDKFKYKVKDKGGNVSNAADVLVYIDNECGIVFPNPTKDLITLVTSNKHARYIRICDVSGRLMKVEDIYDGRREFSMGRYADGVYILNLMTEYGARLCTFKVVKKSEY